MKIDPARIEAHRGASSAFPENTMLAFEAAHRAGALSIETDMSLLADGSFAIFHDDRLGRTVSGDAMIGSLAHMPDSCGHGMSMYHDHVSM